MFNSKTIAWRELTKLTGYGRQNIAYVYATTQIIKEKIMAIKERRGLDMYKKSLDIFNKNRELKRVYDQSDERCAVCWYKLNKNNVIILTCNHTFHHSCIKSMLFIYMDEKCPLCRKVYRYNFNASRKTKSRLKKRIIKYYSNKINRIKSIKIMELAYFLKERYISFGFLEDFMDRFRYISYDDLYKYKYCEFFHNMILFYPFPRGPGML